MWTNENSRVQLWIETQQIDINIGNKHMNNSNAEHSFSPADVFIWTGSRNWSIPSITGRPVPISSARLDVWHSTGDTPGPTEITTGTVEAIDSPLSALNNKRQPPKGENGLLKNSEKNQLIMISGPDVRVMDRPLENKSMMECLLFIWFLDL